MYLKEKKKIIIIYFSLKSTSAASAFLVLKDIILKPTNSTMENIEKTETLDLFVQIFIDLLFKDKNIKLQFTSHLVYILFWSIVLLNEIRDPFSFKLKNKNSNYGLD